MIENGEVESQARFLAISAERFPVPDWYPELFDGVAGRVRAGRQHAAMAKQELFATYWEVGKEILARQDAEGWGARVIDRLACDLKERFPDAKGFPALNLKHMAMFGAAWPAGQLCNAALHSYVADRDRPSMRDLVLRGRRPEMICAWDSRFEPSTIAGAKSRAVVVAVSAKRGAAQMGTRNQVDRRCVCVTRGIHRWCKRGLPK